MPIFPLDSLRRIFTNVRPEQIEPIPWGWENTTVDSPEEEGGGKRIFVTKPTGKILRLDLTRYFNWSSFLLDGYYAYDLYGTKNMKSIFTTATRFLGLETLLMEQPDLTVITDMFCEWNAQLGSVWPFEKPSLFLIGDDYGHNGGLLLSPQSWRSWIAPQLKRLVDIGKQYFGDRVVLHSDGDIHEILDDLSPLGFTGLEYEPVGKMVRLCGHRNYGSLTLWQAPARELVARADWWRW